ncbi:MAG: TetR/AcrR family transcriptional regulator [Candidatus Thorarchaeota archaeon]
MSIVESRGSVTRRIIIQAAYQVFTKKGYHGTTMRAIQQMSGLKSVNALYNHYKSKEVLYLAVLEEMHPLVRVLDIMESASADDVKDMIPELVTVVLTVLKDDSAVLNLMLIEVVEHGGRNLSVLIKKFLPKLSNLSRRLESSKGRLRGTNTTLVIQSMLGFVFSQLLFGQIFSEIAESDTDLLDEHIDLFMKGVVEASRWR